MNVNRTSRPQEGSTRATAARDLLGFSKQDIAQTALEIRTPQGRWKEIPVEDIVEKLLTTRSARSRDEGPLQLDDEERLKFSNAVEQIFNRMTLQSAMRLTARLSRQARSTPIRVRLAPPKRRTPQQQRKGAWRTTKVAPPMPSSGEWKDSIGPVYEAGEALKLLGISKSTLKKRSQERSLLALETLDGYIVYPAFQFTSEKEVLLGLPEVLKEFPDDPDMLWNVASWLQIPLTNLNELSVLDLLRYGKRKAAVKEAHSTASRWST